MVHRIAIQVWHSAADLYRFNTESPGQHQMQASHLCYKPTSSIRAISTWRTAERICRGEFEIKGFCEAPSQPMPYDSACKKVFTRLVTTALEFLALIESSFRLWCGVEISGTLGGSVCSWMCFWSPLWFSDY